MAKFNKALDLIFSNQPIYILTHSLIDEKCYGISRRLNPDWKGWVRIDQIKEEFYSAKWPEVIANDLKPLAINFILTNYWKPLKLRSIPFWLAKVILELALENGKKDAIKIIQRAVNSVNGTIIGLKNLKIDGYLGKKTHDSITYFLDELSHIPETFFDHKACLLSWIMYFKMDDFYKNKNEKNCKTNSIVNWTIKQVRNIFDKNIFKTSA
ncbi:MAG: hypothetical protein ACEPOW_13405 [Bacteroidales bacterium]